MWRRSSSLPPRNWPTISSGEFTSPAPAKGEVVIFNRSHYEDVLVVRVHNLVPQAVWSRRYDQINAFEKELVEGNTHILKFYLHISKQEQLSRFKERLDDPAKQWKISESDYKERKFWDDYMAAYEDVLSRCSTKHAPWFVIPSDHKWFRNLAIARIVVEHLEALDMKFPRPRWILSIFATNITPQRKIRHFRVSQIKLSTAGRAGGLC